MHANSLVPISIQQMMMSITEEWLERLFVKFQTSEEEQDQCRGECLEMVETMREMIPNKSLFEAWEFAGTTPEW